MRLIPVKPYLMPSVKIHDSKVMPCDSVKQLTAAKGALTSYAKEKSINISFFDPRDWPERLQPFAPGSDLAACVGIGITKVTKNKIGHPVFAVVDFFKQPRGEFLNKVFENIQHIVEGDTRTPIEKEKAQTLERLVNAGKIKG